MSKNQKIVFGVIVVVLVAVGIFFTACTPKQTNPAEGKDDVIKIGAILPLTGNSADIGIASQKGMDMCIEKWNSKGGLLGHHIENVLFDSKADPKEGRSLASRMISTEKNLLLIYTQISGVTLNVKEISEENKILLLANIGSSNLLDKNYEHTLRNYISPVTLGQNVIETLKKEYNKNEITVFYVNNELGLSYKNSVTDAAAKERVKIKNEVLYEDAATDYRNVILTAKLQESDVLYISGVGASIGRVIKQMRELGFNGIILCDANLLNNSAVSTAGMALKNVFVLDFFCDTNRNDYKQITEQYRKKYSEEMGIFALLAYQGLDMVFNFIEEKKPMNFQDIAKQMDGYEADTFLGKITIQNHEFVFPLKIKPAITTQ